MVVDYRLVEKRYEKYYSKRYGVSLVKFISDSLHFTNDIISYIEQIEKIFPDCIMWHDLTKIHASIIRCHSLKKFPEENLNLLLTNVSLEWQFIKQIKRQTLLLKNARICEDGVIRLFFNDMIFPIHFVNKVEPLYSKYGFDFDIVFSPWIAVGTVKIDKIKTLNHNSYNLDSIVFNGVLTIDNLNLVFYEDVLFKRIQVII